MGRKFVLVHGSGHGAWCWYKLIDRLQRQGHTAIAVDLYGSGVHQGHPGLVNTLAQYAAPLVDLLHSLPDNKEVILISHSMGGLAATKVMELFPHKIAASVFICSTMLRSGTRALEIVKEIFSDTHMKDIAEFNYSNGPENPPTSVSFQMDKVGEYLYHLSPSQDIVLAKSLLKPNVCLLPSEHVSNTTEDSFPSEKGRTASSFQSNTWAFCRIYFVWAFVEPVSDFLARSAGCTQGVDQYFFICFCAALPRPICQHGGYAHGGYAALVGRITIEDLEMAICDTILDSFISWLKLGFSLPYLMIHQ